MKIFNYIKKNGFKHTWNIFYQYKMNMGIKKILFFVLKNKPLQDIIVIESHNDFDSNGGAFYDYLLREGYNHKYKIVWLLKNKIPKELPQNVMAFPLRKPGIKRNYYICQAKYITADNDMIDKVRPDQKTFYLTHGAGGLKNVRGKMILPDSLDYILTPSKYFAPIHADQYMLPYPCEKLICLGYPAHDTLYDSDRSEIKKITNKSFTKIIIWMPTFRKLANTSRNDSTGDLRLGVPLFDSLEEYDRLNDFLIELDTLLLIKIHPMQDMDTLKISDCSNIKVLTGQNVKELGVDNYRLIKCTDALISDYSSIAFEYLHLNRPIAYVLDDAESYTLGFIVDDISQMMAGMEIYTINDLKTFIRDVVDGKDTYKEKRKQLYDWFYEYHDGNSCKRLAEFMGLSK